jgi:hypothetical protein
MRAIEVSVEALAEPLRQRYLDFAVLSEGRQVPGAALETFWAPLGWNRYDAQDALDEFVRLSLADMRTRAEFHVLMAKRCDLAVPEAGPDGDEQ